MINVDAIFWAFEQMPMQMKVSFVAALLVLFGIFYGTVISPIIFNFFLIPGIEKRLRKTLQYDFLYNYIFLSRWIIPQNEIALYIVRRYVALIFKGEHGLPEKRNRFALKKAGYTIDMATKFEIIMSFLWLLNVLTIIIGGIITFIASGQISVFYHQ